MDPYHWYGPILVMSGVVFAYAAIEMVGIAAGEMENSTREVPKAVNAVIFRIGVFYCGSILLLVLHVAHHRVQVGHQPVRDGVQPVGPGLDGRPDPGRVDRRGDVQPERGAVFHRSGAAQPGDLQAGAGVHVEDVAVRGCRGRAS